MHGAALTNAIFLPPRASVIEIFPYHIFCPLYSKLVNLMGLNYFALYSLVRYTPPLFLLLHHHHPQLKQLLPWSADRVQSPVPREIRVHVDFADQLLSSYPSGETVKYDYMSGTKVSDEERRRLAAQCDQKSSMVIALGGAVPCWFEYMHG
jgi:hypothetical protein